jgi:hypothetical protein
MVSLKLEIYIFTVAKTKLKLTRSTREALRIVSTLRMRIDVAVLLENTRRIFGRAREGNLGSRRIFQTVLAGHKKKLLAGRYLLTPVLDTNVKPQSFVFSCRWVYFHSIQSTRVSNHLKKSSFFISPKQSRYLYGDLLRLGKKKKDGAKW